MPLSNTVASAFVSLEAGGPFRYACPGCHSSETLDVISLPSVPVNCSALWMEQQQALACTTGAIYLRSCRSCGLVYNACFNSALLEYDTAYENSLDFSPVFRAYTRELAQELIDTHGLKNRHIVEIGCGAGKFLKAICQLGQNTGCGYDPSFPGDEQPIREVEFARAYFDP
jgi:late competence protein required for DNA uptake (superfamily II DNA/RNA helicase)